MIITTFNYIINNSRKTNLPTLFIFFNFNSHLASTAMQNLPKSIGQGVVTRQMVMQPGNCKIVAEKNTLYASNLFVYLICDDGPLSSFTMTLAQSCCMQ